MTHRSCLSRRLKAYLLLCLFSVFTCIEGLLLSENVYLQASSFYDSANEEMVILRNSGGEAFNWLPVTGSLPRETVTQDFSIIKLNEDDFHALNLSSNTYQRNVFYVYVSSAAP